MCMSGLWRHDNSSHLSRSRSADDITNSYEHFHSQLSDWHGHSDSDGAVKSVPEAPVQQTQWAWTEWNCSQMHWDPSLPRPCSPAIIQLKQCPHSCPTNNHRLPRAVVVMAVQRRSVWGLVIVTAGRGGKTRVFQNFVALFQVQSYRKSAYLLPVGFFSCIDIFSFSPLESWPRISTGWKRCLFWCLLWLVPALRKSWSQKTTLFFLLLI